MDAPSPQVWPTLRASDARGLISFLVEAFGLEEVVAYGEGDQCRPRPALLAPGRRDHARQRPRRRL
jgi:hypothetical protein